MIIQSTRAAITVAVRSFAGMADERCRFPKIHLSRFEDLSGWNDTKTSTSLSHSLASPPPLASFASPLSQAGRRGVFDGSDQAVEFGFQVGRYGFLAGAAVEVVDFKGVGCEIV